MLAFILSKAMLLAKDTEITDPTILSQLANWPTGQLANWPTVITGL